MPVGALSRVESHRRPLGSVTASDEDMHWLDPHSSPQNLAARWLTLGPRRSSSSRSVPGRRICDLRRDGALRIPASPADVVDTVGAGDAFMTGLIDALCDVALLGQNGIGEDGTGRLDVLANRNLDQTVADEPPSGAQSRAGGLDLDRLRFGHQDGARSLVWSHVNRDTSVLADSAPGRAR